MKRNLFEEIYEKKQDLEKRYDAAEADSEKEGIRAEYEKLMAAINEKGHMAFHIWRECETARKNGNDRLDLSDVIWEKDVKPLIDCMKDSGIDCFTFSSGWSSAVETAWLFLQEGCSLEGMAEINGSMDLFTGEHEKKHGYLFRL